MADIYDVLLAAVSGLLVFITNYLFEGRKKRKDELLEYRKELKKNIDDLIYPLYYIFEELWHGLLGSIDFMQDPPKIVEGTQLISSRRELSDAHDSLEGFIDEKGVKFNLLFPHELQSWKLIRLSAGVNSIIDQIDEGENPVDQVDDLIAECMDFQNNIQNLLGFQFPEGVLDTHLDEPRNKWKESFYYVSIFLAVSLIVNSFIINIADKYKFSEQYFLYDIFSWLHIFTSDNHVIYYWLYWLVTLICISYIILYRYEKKK